MRTSFPRIRETKEGNSPTVARAKRSRYKTKKKKQDQRSERSNDKTIKKTD